MIKFFINLGFVGICFISNVCSQNQGFKIDDLNKNAVSFNVYGVSPAFGISYERVLTQNISAEIGLGLPSIGVGLKYIPFGIKPGNLMLQSGLVFTHVFDIITESFQIIYIPIGISYYGKKQLNFGIDIGPGTLMGEFQVIPFGNIKLGRRF